MVSCYRNALRLAEGRGMTSLGFPAISTGAFGYPADEAAGLALGAVRSFAPMAKSVRRIRFVLFDEAAYRTPARTLELTPPP